MADLADIEHRLCVVRAVQVSRRTCCVQRIFQRFAAGLLICREEPCKDSVKEPPQ